MARYKEKYRNQASFAVVDAIQFTIAPTAFKELEAFIGADAEFRDGRAVAATREGPLLIWPGEWVVKNAKGQFRAVPDALFRSQWEGMQ